MKISEGTKKTLYHGICLKIENKNIRLVLILQFCTVLSKVALSILSFNTLFI